MFRQVSRTLALLLAALAAALVVGISPASAGEYPAPEDCVVHVDDDSPEAGDTVTVSGTGWPADAEVTIFDNDEEVGTATADENGDWSFEYTIPDDATGDHEITADGCAEGAEVLGTTLSVQEPAAEPAVEPADLPRTGSSATEPLVRTGAVLIAAGAVLVYAMRRRNQAFNGS